MNLGVLGHLVLTFGVLSLLSIGGANATLPEIHRQIVDVRHWMDDATFANLVAIGQTAPGPNVLVVSMIGWQIAGIPGLLAASLAVVLPSSFLAFAVQAAITRFASVEWIPLVRAALAPLAVGFMLASGYVMTRAAYEGILSLAITAAAMVMIVATRRSPLVAIAAGACIGVIGHRVHLFA